jgi:conjugal transfer pilin signal peptidase TrbI
MSTSMKSDPLTVTNMLDKGRAFWTLFVQHVKAYATTWVLLACLYGVFHANYRLAINQTPSLPYDVFLIHLDATVKKEGLVAFKWYHGIPYPDGHIFVKRVAATPGDTVIKKGRNFIVGQHTLIGKEVGLSKRKLSPNDELHEGRNTIPVGKYFVAGDHEYSLDSRYDLLGLVDEKDVIGSAYPIF